jgi:N-acetylneuraminic acid mutarotase
MRHLQYIFILVFIGYLFLTCTKEEISPRSYPRITTYPVKNITKSGAVFHGEVLSSGDSEILEHGFVWGKNPSPNYNNSEKTILKSSIQSGVFTAEIESALEVGITYYVAAFVKTEEQIVFGVEVKFESLGSKAPTIARFEPAEGIWGDTIRIYGQYFSSGRIVNIVNFGDHRALIINESDTAISALVPLEITKSERLSVSVAGNIGVAEDPFRLLSPILSSVDKSTVLSFDTVKIEGENLVLDNMTELLFNGKKAKILDLQNNLYEAIVPPALSSSDSSILIELIHRKFKYSELNGLQYLAPSVGNVYPSQVRVGDTIVIKGANFQARSNYDSLYLDNIKTPLLATFSDSLVSIIPIGVNEKTLDVKLQTSGYSFVFPDQIVIKPPQINSISPQLIGYNDTLLIQGSGFHPVIHNNQVFIGGYEGQMVSGDSTQLKVLLPNNPRFDQTGKIDFSFQAFGYRIEDNTALLFKAPSITEITPSKVDYEGLITIRGSDLQSTVGSNSFKINGVSADVVESDQSYQIIKVPSSLQTNNLGELNIVMNAGNYFISDNSSVRLNLPVISVVKDSLISTTKDVIEVHGDFFTGMDNILLLLDNHVCEILNWQKDKLQVKVNSAFIENLSYNGPVQVLLKLVVNNSATVEKEVIISSDFNELPVSLYETFPSAPRYGSFGFTLGNKIYVGGGQDEDNKFSDFWSYDPSTNTWNQQTGFTGSARSDAFSHSFNGSGLVGFGVAQDNSGYSDIWRYNISADTWTKITDHPLIPYTQVISYIENNKIHFIGGLGRPTQNSERHDWDHHYTYDPVLNQWDSLSSTMTDPELISGFNPYPVAPYSSVFTQDGVNYLFLRIHSRKIGSGGGVSDTRIFILKEDKSDNEWKIHYEFDHGTNYFDSWGAVIDNKLYLVLSQYNNYTSVWEYEPEINELNKLVELKEVFWKSKQLVLDDKIFLMFGYYSYQPFGARASRKIWVIDPSKL